MYKVANKTSNIVPTSWLCLFAIATRFDSHSAGRIDFVLPK